MKKKIIILSILGILLIALGISGYNLWNNYISPVITATKLTEEELKEATDDKKLIEDITGLKLREMTEEEKAAIESGEKQEGEVMEQILKEAMDEKIKETSDTVISAEGNEEKKKDSETSSDKPSSDKTKSESAKDKASDSSGKSSSEDKSTTSTANPPYKKPAATTDSSIITAKYLGELYSLQSTYSGIVAGMIPQIKSYYYNLRKVQKYDRESAIAATSKAYLGKVNATEAECDSKVNGVISRMEKELKANGHSTEIISTVKSRYAAEKKSKRAYYVKLLMGN